MSLTRLTCASIGDLDEGRAAAVVDAALATIYRDLEDRGHDEKPRTLTIKVAFAAAKGLITVDVQVAPSLPSYRTNLTSGKMLTNRDSKEPVLCFQEHDAENPDQATFDQMDK